MSQQLELFSLFANQAMYTRVDAYSHRQGVNVLIGQRTFEFSDRPRKGQSRADFVKEIVTDVVKEYTKNRLSGAYDPDKGWSITSGTSIIRGHYRFTVWCPKHH